MLTITFDKIKIGGLYLATYYIPETSHQFIVFVTSKSAYQENMFHVPLIYGISGYKKERIEYFNYYFEELT